MKQEFLAELATARKCASKVMRDNDFPLIADMIDLGHKDDEPAVQSALLAIRQPKTPPETAPGEVTQAIALIDELNERATSRQFFGINQTLHEKLCTIRATLRVMLHRTRATRQDGLREALELAQEKFEQIGIVAAGCATSHGDNGGGLEIVSGYASDGFQAIASALSDISPLANDTGALREDREQGEIIITGLMEVLDDLLKGQDSAYWLLRERARWWLNGDEKPAALSDISPLANEDPLFKLRMVISHATGGNCADETLSVNDICVRITAHRNAIYQAGKDAAVPLANDTGALREGEDGLADSIAWEQWPSSFDTDERDAARAGAKAALAENVLILCQYRDDLRHPPTGDSVERRLAMVENLIREASE